MGFNFWIYISNKFEIIVMKKYWLFSSWHVETPIFKSWTDFVAEFFSNLLYILNKKQKIKKENVNLVWVKCPKV